MKNSTAPLLKKNLTDELVLSVDLDARQPLPKAPWFEPGASRSARRVFTHILAETAQHAGHADILRETIDGRKSMGRRTYGARRHPPRDHRRSEVHGVTLTYGATFATSASDIDD